MASSKREREANVLKKRKLAKQRFRNLIRSVVLNRIWLMDTGEQKLSLNVKKNIAMLVRTERKIGLLTLAEKALIRTNTVFRSVEDRKKLVTLLAGMTCFSKIPPKVRARLVSKIEFMVMSAGRVIIKEGDDPSTIYFLLTGEVEITRKTWDRITNSYVDKVEFICGPGDCLGDIELIENCPRRSTFISTTDVEVLVVFYDDFNRILRPIMTKQWMEKKHAIMALHYFDFLNEEQITAACKLGVLRQFEPLETIYYEDKGQVSYVHFVVSGECMILQCLKMKVTYRKGGKSFEMIDIGKGDQDGMFQDLTSMDLMKKLKEGEITQNSTNYNLSNMIDSSSEDFEEDGRKTPVRKMDIKTVEISCGFRQPSVDRLTSPQENVSVHTNVDGNISEPNDLVENLEMENLENTDKTEVKKVADLDGGYGEVLSTNTKINENRPGPDTIDAKKSVDIMAPSKSTASLKYQLSKIRSRTKSEMGSMDTVIPSENAEDEISKRKSNVSLNPSVHKSSQISISSKNEVFTRIENHFIDVGSMTYGGIFGLGEKLEHRVIMARTTVQCLMLPRFWLLDKEQNPGNAWQRRRFYLDSTIPSRDSLFKDFLTTRKWQKFKNDLIQNNINQPTTIGNPTKVQDIPVICRIVEANDD